MKRSHFLSLAALALSASACSTPPAASNPQEPLRASAPLAAAKSLIVISTWAKEKNNRTPSEIVIKRIADGKTVGRAHIDNPEIKPHFAEGWGYVNAFELEPGDYAIELYALEPLYQYAHPGARIPFNVGAGQKLYLGQASFYVKDDYGYLQIRDKSERDLTILKQKNPTLAAEAFQKALPADPAHP